MAQQIKTIEETFVPHDVDERTMRANLSKMESTDSGQSWDSPVARSPSPTRMHGSKISMINAGSPIRQSHIGSVNMKFSTINDSRQTNRTKVSKASVFSPTQGTSKFVSVDANRSKNKSKFGNVTANFMQKVGERHGFMNTSK
jgi:hypothetical protein